MRKFWLRSPERLTTIDLDMEYLLEPGAYIVLGPYDFPKRVTVWVDGREREEMHHTRRGDKVYIGPYEHERKVKVRVRDYGPRALRWIALNDSTAQSGN